MLRHVTPSHMPPAPTSWAVESPNLIPSITSCLTYKHIFDLSITQEQTFSERDYALVDWPKQASWSQILLMKWSTSVSKGVVSKVYWGQSDNYSMAQCHIRWERNTKLVLHWMLYVVISNTSGKRWPTRFDANHMTQKHEQVATEHCSRCKICVRRQMHSTKGMLAQLCEAARGNTIWRKIGTKVVQLWPEAKYFCMTILYR